MMHAELSVKYRSRRTPHTAPVAKYVVWFQRHGHREGPVLELNLERLSLPCRSICNKTSASLLYLRRCEITALRVIAGSWRRKRPHECDHQRLITPVPRPRMHARSTEYALACRRPAGLSNVFNSWRRRGVQRGYRHTLRTKRDRLRQIPRGFSTFRNHRSGKWCEHRPAKIPVKMAPVFGCDQ